MESQGTHPEPEHIDIATEGEPREHLDVVLIEMLRRI